MKDFRLLAAKIDQHMQQLSAQGVNDAHAVTNRMMGYVPDLHKIWVGTSDEQHKQLAAQSLATAVTLERGYQLHREWLSDLESFKSSLRAQGAEPKALECSANCCGYLENQPAFGLALEPMEGNVAALNISVAQGLG